MSRPFLYSVLLLLFVRELEASPIVSCLTALAELDRNVIVFEDPEISGPPEVIFGAITQKILRAEISQGDIRPLAQILWRQRQLDIIFSKAIAQASQANSGYGISDPAYELSSQELQIVSRKEFAKMIEQITENMALERTREVYGRQGSLVWTGVLMLANAHEVFPEYLAYLIQKASYSEIPPSVVRAAEGSKTFEHYLLGRIARGLARAKKYFAFDPFSQKHRFAVDYVSFLAANPETYSAFVDEITYAIESPNEILSIDSLYQVSIAMSKKHESNISSLIHAMIHIADVRAVEIRNNPKWQSIFLISVRQGLEAVFRRDALGTSDYPIQAQHILSAPHFSNADRVSLVEMLFKNRDLFSTEEWKLWIMKAFGFERFEKFNFRGDAELRVWLEAFEPFLMKLFEPSYDKIPDISILRSSVQSELEKLSQKHLFPKHFVHLEPRVNAGALSAP